MSLLLILACIVLRLIYDKAMYARAGRIARQINATSPRRDFSHHNTDLWCESNERIFGKGFNTRFEKRADGHWYSKDN